MPGPIIRFSADANDGDGYALVALHGLRDRHVTVHRVGGFPDHAGVVVDADCDYLYLRLDDETRDNFARYPLTWESIVSVTYS